MNSFVEGEDISWEAFDKVIKRNLPAFFLGGLHHIARSFLSPIEPNQSSSGNTLLETLSNNSGILRYPMLAQLHTFFPSRAGDIEWNNLHNIQSHSKSNPLTFASLKSVLHAYKKPTILLLAGYQTDILNPSSKKYVVVGALIRSPWTEIEAECQDETRLWKTMLFQLAPVQRVYATRKEEHNSFPVLQTEGIGIGREVTGSSMEAELGTTGFIINANLDTAVFEHGKRDSRDGVFETFCPFGVGMEGPLRMEVSALEVWGC
ncbi:hypothetical protein B0O99DRAFT_183527 [Bisporella sp. PMI_857]|nr:hypothetical protein B0O99DRAFT_183527 [Bisporella sp. PMI_857]